jgi:hypothetical protein
MHFYFTTLFTQFYSFRHYFQVLASPLAPLIYLPNSLFFRSSITTRACSLLRTDTSSSAQIPSSSSTAHPPRLWVWACRVRLYKVASLKVMKLPSEQLPRPWGWPWGPDRGCSGSVSCSEASDSVAAAAANL